MSCVPPQPNPSRNHISFSTLVSDEVSPLMRLTQYQWLGPIGANHLATNCDGVVLMLDASACSKISIRCRVLCAAHVPSDIALNRARASAFRRSFAMQLQRPVSVHWRHCTPGGDAHGAAGRHPWRIVSNRIGWAFARQAEWEIWVGRPPVLSEIHRRILTDMAPRDIARSRCVAAGDRIDDLLMGPGQGLEVGDGP